MNVNISLTDFDCDWALKEKWLTPRENPTGFMDLNDIIALYARLGIDRVEITHPYWSDMPADKVRRLWNDAGIDIFSYMFFVNLAQPKAERQGALDEARGIVDRIVAYGADKGFIIPGMFSEDHSLENQRDWMIEGLRELAAYAAERGVLLHSENCEWPPIRPLMGSGGQCRDICAAVDSPAYRLIWDVCCSIFVEEDTYVALEAMKPYLAMVHVKNYRPFRPDDTATRFLDSDAGKRYVGCLLSEGVIDMPQAIGKLREMNYEGDILIEYQGEGDPQSALPENIGYLKSLVE